MNGEQYVSQDSNKGKRVAVDTEGLRTGSDVEAALEEVV